MFTVLNGNKTITINVVTPVKVLLNYGTKTLENTINTRACLNARIDFQEGRSAE